MEVSDEYAALLFFNLPESFNVVCTQNGRTNHFHTDVGFGWNINVNEMYAPNLSHEFVDQYPAKVYWTYSSLKASS